MLCSSVSNATWIQKFQNLFSGNICNKYQAVNQADSAGGSCQRDDLSAEQYTQEKQKITDHLKVDAKNRFQIERNTVLQSGCSLWFEMRKMRVTASYFGRILNVRSSSSYRNIVKSILYGSFSSKYTDYGIVNEPNAIRQMMKQENVVIVKCGLFIHKEYPCLAASPDGLIDHNGMVEIKCPWSAADMTVTEGIEAGKITVWKKTNKNDPNEMPVLNVNHAYFYQVQGQLEIGEKDYCLFGVWTPKEMRVEKIYRDREFFKNKMRNKLLAFYVNSLLPEIVDSRAARNMALRDCTSMYTENVYDLFGN